jgi:hypothetical protein
MMRAAARAQTRGETRDRLEMHELTRRREDAKFFFEQKIRRGRKMGV